MHALPSAPIRRPRPARPVAPRLYACLRAVLAAALLVLLAGLQPAPAAAQTIRAVTESTPISYQQDGRVAGTATAVVERTLKQAGFADVRLAVYPWARAYAQAQEEPHVLIYPIARTPEREARFQWVGELMRREVRLYALAGRPELRTASLADARRLTIGVVRDDVRHQYLQQQGFPRLVVSAEPGDSFRKLLARQVDAVPLADSVAQVQCAQAGSRCPGLVRLLTLDGIATGVWLAYSPQTPAPVVERTRAAFEALRADGTVARLMAGGDAARPAPAAARGR
ncbi:transporter substrate-binding domain-containing protein [uncultured Xylophilus sp.]|uniref:substrate-binding periplasmic protein n=1 Tax=uncultured Xylophilus sp. TaxID=296832 RepID=UPI0025E087BD|nr:transporter substrate-binding domain-containing protein [uncultured Xylophilus sp.]